MCVCERESKNRREDRGLEGAEGGARLLRHRGEGGARLVGRALQIGDVLLKTRHLRVDSPSVDAG